MEKTNYNKDTKPNRHTETIDRIEQWSSDYWSFSNHAIEQCIERDITRDEVIECLQYGKISYHPDYDNQEIAKLGRLRVIFDFQEIITVFENERETNKWDKEKALTKGQKRGITSSNRGKKGSSKYR